MPALLYIGWMATRKFVQHRRYLAPQRTGAATQWGARTVTGTHHFGNPVLPIHVESLGNALNAAYRRATGQASRGGNYVYFGMTQQGASYIGITNDPVARQHQHGLRHHLMVLNRRYPMTRIQVRAIEQAFINRGRTMPRNQNIANSIAGSQPYYPLAIRFGNAFAVWILGYYPNVRLV
jgi:hypothetical protein